MPAALAPSPCNQVGRFANHPNERAHVPNQGLNTHNPNESNKNITFEACNGQQHSTVGQIERTCFDRPLSGHFQLQEPLQNMYPMLSHKQKIPLPLTILL
jgi:hypothetical protein